MDALSIGIVIFVRDGWDAMKWNDNRWNVMGRDDALLLLLVLEHTIPTELN